MQFFVIVLGVLKCFEYKWDRSFDVCTPKQDGNSQVSCDRQVATDSTFCHATNLVVDPSHVTVSAGGEEIMAVLGRKEPMEFPRFSKGGLLLAGCTMTSDGLQNIAMFRGNYLTNVVQSLSVTDTIATQCRCAFFQYF
jgi:hypothetical protein